TLGRGDAAALSHFSFVAAAMATVVSFRQETRLHCRTPRPCRTCQESSCSLRFGAASMTRRMVDYRCGRPARFGRTGGWKSFKGEEVCCGVWPPHSIARSEIRGWHGQIGPFSTMNTYGAEQSSERIDDASQHQ